MDMKMYMLIFKIYPCWWIGKKSEVVIKWRQLLEKVGNSYYENQQEKEVVLKKKVMEQLWNSYKGNSYEIGRLENEVVIS